ncbi:MAG: hypothetical protein ACOH1Y_14825 [Propionicimonas sp.]
MSRTVHHIAYTHRDGNCSNHDCAYNRLTIPAPLMGWSWLSAKTCDFTGPDHTITELRYSAVVLAAAGRTGARPIPEPVTATMPMHRHQARSWQLDTMGASVRDQSRADRRRTGPGLRALTGDVNAFLRGHGPDRLPDWCEADAVVVAPTRHRRNVRAEYGW